MSKTKIVNIVARNTGIDKNTISLIVDETVAAIKSSIINGDAVILRGFGTFSRKLRKEKVARDILNDRSVIIPEHYAPSFKPAKEFFAAVVSSTE